jgi:hypothetical protein
MATNAEMDNENPRSAEPGRTGPGFAAEFDEPRTILDGAERLGKYRPLGGVCTLPD